MLPIDISSNRIGQGSKVKKNHVYCQPSGGSKGAQLYAVLQQFVNLGTLTESSSALLGPPVRGIIEFPTQSYVT